MYSSEVLNTRLPLCEPRMSRSSFIFNMFKLIAFSAITWTLRAIATQAPYLRSDDDVLKGDYVVHFHEGHSLDKHQAHIGRSLGDAEGLRIHDWLPGYRATLDDDTLHQLIRNDPGVKLGMYCKLSDHLYQLTPN
jgi:hypothetical protein